MASLMINFRLTEELAKALDLAARQQGLNRSDYIRQILKTAIGMNGAKPVPPEPAAAEACKHLPEDLKMTTYGFKVCKCGVKVR